MSLILDRCIYWIKMTLRKDLRARLTVKNPKSSRSSAGISPNAPAYARVGRSNAPSDIAFSGPADALIPHGGIMFPFTPNISASHSVDYSQYSIVHANYQQNAYTKTNNPTLQVTGMFVSQTPAEARYTIGVMHFLRVMTKMHFGVDDVNAGTPPPVLEFSAFGTFNFNRIPVVIASFSFNYEDSADLIEVDVGGEINHVPTMMNISLELLPQYNPTLQNKFLLSEFASGTGYKKGFI